MIFNFRFTKDAKTLDGHGADEFANAEHEHSTKDIVDLAEWAKAKSKPEYSYSEIKNTPSIPAAVAVKGNAESSYRTGNVNLTPANIGALATGGGTVSGNLEVTGELTNGGNTVLHSGNSAKVVIDTTAPSDTTGNVLFINTSA